MTEIMAELGTCQVRSETDRPCHRVAVARIRGVPFCEPCAREQEAYFAIGELTEVVAEGFREEPLVELLDRMRRTMRYRGGNANAPHAA